MALRVPQSCCCCCFLRPGSGGVIPQSTLLRSLLLPPHHKLEGGAQPTRRRRRRRMSVTATAEYKRIPMETPGAYQLINETTGEKFIVWGDTDGQDSSIPPPDQQLLSWKPNNGVEANVTAADKGSKLMTHISASTANFGRLKANHIKLLIKKSSKLREKTHNNSESSIKDASLSHSNQDSVEFLREKSSQIWRRHKEQDNNATTIEGRSSLDIIPKQESIAADVRFPVRVEASGSLKTTTFGRLKQHESESRFFSKKSFKELGCSDDIIESLRSQMFVRPSHIQAMAYGRVLEGKSCIIADQSGSGKTLAYLVPIIQRLRQEEQLGLGKSLPRSPRVLILAPTSELASQVLNKCRSMAKSGVPFRSMVATGGFRQKTQLDNLQQELDVVIATPGRFTFLLQEGFLQLTNLKCVVLDEVDILFGDEGFEQVLQSLISSVPVETQYLFVTATLPLEIYKKLVEAFPDCEVSMGPSMHRTSSGLEEILVDCSGDFGEDKNPDTAFSNKKTALLQILEESPVSKTIIFCNKIETCRKVENVLKRVDRSGFRIKTLPFHAALAQEIRLSNMKEFINPQSKDSMFLICTDRASRGIDFVNVDHVILFDYPRDPSEYVRRVGRTARGAGGKGKAFVFAVGKQVSLAGRIMERNKKGHPIHDVPSAYEF